MTDSRAKILIVEDDPVARTMLSAYFGDNGFQIFEAESGAKCLSTLKQQPIDIILLDINLPDGDGIQLAKDIKNDAEVGIIFVTSRTDAIDLIVGLELAGDDFVCKPVQLRELLARVRALLRRKGSGRKRPHDTLLGFGRWRIDLVRRELSDQAGSIVHLTRGEFDLLAALAEARGRPLSRAYLIEVVSRESDINERTVDALIVRLRRKLADAGAIETVHSVGYKLALEVRSQ